MKEKVSDLINPQIGGWNRDKIKCVFSTEISAKILQTPIGLTGGVMNWSGHTQSLESTLLNQDIMS